MSIDFILSAFEQSITLDESAGKPVFLNTSVASNAVITLTLPVVDTAIQKAFYFRTRSLNSNNTDQNIHFYVDNTKWPLLTSTINPKNGLVTTNTHAGSSFITDDVGKDFLRDLALQLFGTIFGVDLFTNEEEVIGDIYSKCDVVANEITTLFNSIDKISGNNSFLNTDSASGEQYFDDSYTDTQNISRELFIQLLHSAPERFSNIQTDWLYNTTDDGFYRMPILAGDKITYKLTIRPSLDQRQTIQTSNKILLPRSYLVSLLVVNDGNLYNNVSVRDAIVEWRNLTPKPEITDPTHIRNWNTENVTNMSSLFLGDTLFNEDISLWNTAKVTDMSNMFNGASSFNHNIGGWNTSSVTTMTNMFKDALALKAIYPDLPDSPIISTVDTFYTENNFSFSVEKVVF